MKSKIEHKQFAFELKDLKEDQETKRATFTGYASTFGNRDLGGDIVAKGAFTKSISSGKPIIVLADHTPTVKSNIGFGFNLIEDEHGLSATTELNLEKEAGREAYAMLKQAKEVGYDIGLSIGFAIDDSGWDEKTRTRTIKEATLWEYSVVVFPMNPKATVTSLKSLLESGDGKELAETKRRIEVNLREAGLSKSEAEQFCAVGFKSLGEQDEVDAVSAINQLTEKIKGQ